MMYSHDHYKGMIFVGSSIVLSACAQLFMKSGMLNLATTSALTTPAVSPLHLFTPAAVPALLWVTLGLCCYTISMLCWMAALARYELSLAYPLLSLSYVLVYIGAVLWPGFNESMTGLRSSGIVLIVIGVILVTRSGSSTIDQINPEYTRRV